MHSAIKENSRQKPRTLLFAFMAFAVVFLGSPATGQTATGQFVISSRPQSIGASISELATGKLLIANRHLRDPNFAETVILLLEYSKDSAMGVVINRPTTVHLATVLSEMEALKTRTDLVYLGGPVGRNQMLLLARTAQEPADAKQILDNVYLVSSQEALQQLVEHNDAALNLRAYVGYAGWAPQQLDAEVARGDWHIYAADATVVFDTPAAQLWQKLISRSEFEWTHHFQNNEHTTYSLY
ncbi:MAG: YqgE/AlgH family protein [Candidatus Binatia bacterium]